MFYTSTNTNAKPMDSRMKTIYIHKITIVQIYSSFFDIKMNHPENESDAKYGDNASSTWITQYFRGFWSRGQMISTIELTWVKNHILQPLYRLSNNSNKLNYSNQLQL